MNTAPLIAAAVALAALVAAAEQPKAVSVHDGDTPARREPLGEISWSRFLAINVANPFFGASNS